MTITILLLISLTYYSLLTQFELKLSRRPLAGENDPVFGRAELSPRLALFFVILAVISFFYYFSGGVLGAVALAPLVFFLFILCS